MKTKCKNKCGKLKICDVVGFALQTQITPISFISFPLLLRSGCCKASADAIYLTELIGSGFLRQQGILPEDFPQQRNISTGIKIET